jgi:hypothetical protein
MLADDMFIITGLTQSVIRLPFDKLRTSGRAVRYLLLCFGFCACRAQKPKHS